ncbi:hypothetical protein [Microtetraspora niveoalba]|nr:hypothetical protein [Microtetraspora niveoalba]
MSNPYMTDAKQYNVSSDATIDQNRESGAGLYDEINPGRRITLT